MRRRIVVKIAIYGAGNYGKYVFDEIINHECAKVSVACWIDNFLDEHRKNGLPVLTEKVFLESLKYNEIDAVVVAIDRDRTAYKAAVSLLSHGFKKVYLAMPKGFVPKIPILTSEGRLGPLIKPYSFFRDIKPTLPYIEIRVNKHCNLKCKRCGNFSNLETNRELLDINKFENYLKQLKKKFKCINCINLLGGEPLLNPQLPLYLELVKEYFPESHSQITTNGLLIPRMSSELVDTIIKCATNVYISQYLPTREMLDKIIDFLETRQISYAISPQVTQFRKMISRKGGNADKAFAIYAGDECTCHAIEEGRIYICSLIESVYAMQNYLGIHISESEFMNASIDLMSDDIDGWDIMQYLGQPTSLCRFCAAEDEWVSWETGQPKKEDWIID